MPYGYFFINCLFRSGVSIGSCKQQNGIVTYRCAWSPTAIRSQDLDRNLGIIPCSFKYLPAVANSRIWVTSGLVKNAQTARSNLRLKLHFVRRDHPALIFCLTSTSSSEVLEYA